MSVSIRITPKGLFKRKISIEDIIGEKLLYGIYDENFRLIPNEQGSNTLIFDIDRLTRGIEFRHENDDVVLRLSIPTDEQEIRLYYSLVVKICRFHKTDSFLRDGKTVYTAQISDCIENDIRASSSALNDIAQQITSGKIRYFTIFGVMEPLSIGTQEISVFDNSLERFGDWLNSKQQIDAHYASPLICKNGKKQFGVYAIGENIVSIVPTSPYTLTNVDGDVSEWYAILGSQDHSVPYDDFIREIKNKEYIDANHVIISLSKDEIDSIARVYKKHILLFR